MAHDHPGRDRGFRQPLTVRVPSKVNLFLAVRGRRGDGYHELVSVMQTVSIRDALTVRLEGSAVACLHPAARKHMGLELHVEGGGGLVPQGEDNLSVRAAQRLLQRLGRLRTESPSRSDAVTVLELSKSIPVASGMAGGSADAAATLVALNELWGCGLDQQALQALAADLGADVPFCIAGGTVLATGTGTSTAQVLSRGTYHWVVGVSDEPLSTADVYRAWDEVGEPSEVEPDAVLAALRTGDAEALGAALHNGLEVAAFSLRPDLRGLRQAMLEAGAAGAVVSGSGPTILGLAHDAVHARSLANAVRPLFARVEVATSPAGGPEFAGSERS